MISHGKDIKIFTGNANPALAQEICKLIGIKLGEAEVKSFGPGADAKEHPPAERGQGAHP